MHPSGARTSLDLAPLVRFQSLRRALRRSEELEAFDLDDFRSVLARNRGHHGAPILAGYELDIYWPELRFAVEIDVYATHGSHEPFEQDRLRDEDLKLAGIELTRVTGHRFEREPRQVAERISRLLEQRRRQLATGDGW